MSHVSHVSPSHRRSRVVQNEAERAGGMRDATGRGLGRPRRLLVVFLSLGHPRARWSCPWRPVRFWRAEERSARAMRWSRWDSKKKMSIWSCSPSCMTRCLLSDGIYICSIYPQFSPSQGLGFPSRGRVQRRDPAPRVRELSRRCTAGSAPIGAGGGFSRGRPSLHVHSAALCQTPGEDPRPIQSANRLGAKVGDQSGVTTAPATTIYR